MTVIHLSNEFPFNKSPNLNEKSNEIKIFGTDGVRGRANTYPMTVETALALGRAAGKFFRSSQWKA